MFQRNLKMPSSVHPTVQESTVLPTATRYDQETQKRIVALALQLQQQHQETVSAVELEAIAVEVGLDPTFIRQAIVLTEHSQAEAVSEMTGWGLKRFRRRLSQPSIPWSKKDFAVFGIALIVASLAGNISGLLTYGGFAAALLLGYFVGPKRGVYCAGAAVMAAEIISMFSHNSQWTYGWIDWIGGVLLYSFLGTALSGIAALFHRLFKTPRLSPPSLNSTG
jgi:hypothetical protein